jgi:hypothetical protein
MKRIAILVYFLTLVCTWLGFVPVSQANNNLEYSAAKEMQADDTDVIVNGLIDLLAGAYDKKSPYYDKEFAEAVKADIQQLIIASRAVVLHDDFKKILNGLDKILMLNDNTDINKNTLAIYLKQVLKGMKPLTDDKTAKELLLTLSSVDKNLFTGKDGIIEGMIMMSHNNMYGQKRASSDINVSALRSLLLMIACADYQATLQVNGKDTGIKLLSLLDSPDHPSSEPGTVKSQTLNLGNWFIGEIVTAIRWGREGKIKLNGKYVYMDQFQAYDWLMFKKRYQMSGVGYEPMKFEGIVGMVSNVLVQSIMPAPAVEGFPALVELGGGMTEIEYHGGGYDGFTSTSWKNRYGTAGKRHKVLALFAPMMEYWWNARDAQGNRRIGDMVHMMAGVNEIPVTDYVSLEKEGKQNPDATFRNDSQFKDKSVLKTIEDSELVSAGLRSHALNDTGFGPPAMDLFFRVTKKLQEPHSVPEGYLKAHPGFAGDTLLDVVFAEMGKIISSKRQLTADATSIDRIFEILFVPLEGQKNSLVTKLGSVVHVAAQAAEDEQFSANFRNNLGTLLDATEKLVMSFDINHLLNSTDKVLSLNDNPDPQKNTLAKFSYRALRGLAPISDGDTIKGMLLALASMDSKALRDVAKLNEDLTTVLTSNMYGQNLKTAELKTSELRTLLFMIQAADIKPNLVLGGIDTGIPMLSMLDSPFSGTVKDQTVNMAQWAIGEIVTALRLGREGRIIIAGKPVTMDTFQAFDWVMYKKRYDLKFAGIPLMSFNGMAGMLSNKLVQIFLPPEIIDSFSAFVDLGGGMTDAEYSQGTYNGFTDTSWQDRYGTAGRRHKLFALVAPLMEYSWNHRDANGRQRSGDLIQVMAGLNEIPLSPAYKRLKKGSEDNSVATFNKDDQPSVLKTVEDTGLLVTLVKKRGESDIVAPALDLLITVVAKFNQKDSAPPDYKKNNPGFMGNTLLDVVFTELDIKGYKQSSEDASDPIQKIMDILFAVEPGMPENKNRISRIQSYIQRFVNHINAEIKDGVVSGSGSTSRQLQSDSSVKGGVL